MANFIEATEAIANKIRPFTTTNLVTLLKATDGLIESAVKIAQQTGDFSEVQAHNMVRTAIIDVMDERDVNLFDNYLAEKAAA
jgi:hypothetical protein